MSSSSINRHYERAVLIKVESVIYSKIFDTAIKIEYSERKRQKGYSQNECKVNRFI